VKVDICRSGTCICRVVRNPQLGIIDSNRRCSSVKEIRSSHLHRSLIYGMCYLKMKGLKGI
jgi:hypothetical protein